MLENVYAKLIQKFRRNDEKILVILKYRCKQLSNC